MNRLLFKGRELLWFSLLFVMACSTAPRIQAPVQPPPSLEEWCASYEAMLRGPLMPSVALHAYDGNLGLLENPQEGEIGVGRAVYTFQDGAKEYLDGALQAGVWDIKSGTFHFLLPGDSPARLFECMSLGYREHAESGPYVMDAEIQFLEADAVLVTFTLSNKDTDPRKLAAVFRSRTVEDQNPKSARYRNGEGLVLYYNHPSPDYGPSESVFTACLPLFEINRGHCARESYIGSELASGALTTVNPFFWTIRGRASGYLAAPVLELPPQGTYQFRFILAIHTGNEESALKKAQDWASRVREGAIASCHRLSVYPHLTGGSITAQVSMSTCLPVARKYL